MNDSQSTLTRRRITFVADARQRLKDLDTSLLALERDPNDPSARESALRALHTLKGNAGLVHMDLLAQTAHALEEMVKHPCDPQIISWLRRGLDTLSSMVAIWAENLEQSPPHIPILDALQAIHPTAAYPLTSSQTASAPIPPQVTIPVAHLDALIAHLEELSAAHTALSHAPAEMLDRHLAHQRRLLRDLYHAILKTRLLPITQAFAGLERLVDDLADSLDRQARLVITSDDAEIDRTALDPVRHLVVHLLRNALAHGIESPEVRQAAGKPASGTITLAIHATEEGVSIDVHDDGRGLDRTKIIERAVETGLCSKAEADTLSDEQVWMLLTRSGFSTQAQPDSLAGRGMGLAAVRRGVEDLRGRMSIHSSPGEGTTISLWLPAMIALEEVVLVGIGEETYAIPQAVIERINDRSKEELPTVDLAAYLNVPGAAVEKNNKLIVCRRGQERLGILVERIAGREEALIKPLPKQAHTPAFRGAIVTGTRVILVLAIEQLPLSPL